MKGLTRQIVLALAGPMMVYALSFLSTNFSDFEGSGPDASGSSYYDIYATSVSPAPFTFAVWLPIFLGIIAFSIFQALPRNRDDVRLDALALPLLAAFVLNALTGVVSLGVSVLVIIGLLIALVFVFGALTPFKAGKGFTWLVRVPLVMFFSWIVVATIVTISQWLVSINWNGLGVPADLWGAVLILSAAAIGYIVIDRSAAVSFAIPLIWGFIGIVIVDPSALPVVTACVLGGGTLLWRVFSLERSKGKLAQVG